MPFCECQMRKVIVVSVTCEKCGEKFGLTHLAIESRYTLRGDSSRPQNDPRNEVVPEEIVFALAGKCRCGFEDLKYFNLEQLADLAEQLKRETEDKGVEDADTMFDPTLAIPRGLIM